MINWAQVRALLRVRGKLTWRRFTGEKGRILAALFALLFFAPLIAGATFGTWLGYTQLTGRWPYHLLAIVLGLLWVMWIVIPVLFATLSEDVAIEQLLSYPLRQREIVLSLLAGTLFDYPTYFVLPLLAAGVVAFGWSPAFPIVFLGVIVAYGHMVLSSQIMLTALGGLLQSRRFRDVAVILLSLSGFSCYFASQGIEFVSDRLGMVIDGGDLSGLALWQPLDTLQWLPPGSVARSVELATGGSWGAALLWLLYAIGWLVLLGWLWSQLVGRLVTGGGFLFAGGEKAKQKKVAQRGRGDAWLEGWISADLLAIIQKELKSAWRIPQRRINTLVGLLFPFLFFAFSFANNDITSGIPDQIGLTLPFYALYTFWGIGLNMLGWEHRGLPTLLLTTVPRQRIFLGKSAALGLLGGVPLVAFALFLWLRTGNGTIWLNLITALCAGVVVLGVTSAASALLPHPVQLEYRGGRNRGFSGGGCLTALGNTLVVPLSILMLVAPLALPALITLFWSDWEWLNPFLLLGGVVYAAVAFILLTRWAARVLLQREPEVLAAARPIES